MAPEPSDGEWVCFLLIINRCCDPESRSLGLELVLIGDARDVFKDIKIALDPCFSLSTWRPNHHFMSYDDSKDEDNYDNDGLHL